MTMEQAIASAAIFVAAGLIHALCTSYTSCDVSRIRYDRTEVLVRCKGEANWRRWWFIPGSVDVEEYGRAVGEVGDVIGVEVMVGGLVRGRTALKMPVSLAGGEIAVLGGRRLVDNVPADGGR